MAFKRLTKNQKIKILEAFRDGKTTQSLSEEYKCSPNTISRTVKLLISKEEYAALKEDRIKDQNSKSKLNSSNISSENKNLFKEKKEELSKNKDQNSFLKVQDEEDFDKENQELKLDNDIIEKDKSIKENIAVFEEIEPLISSFGFEAEKQKVACQSLDVDNLPESVYMLVDKKVELDIQQISELSEWSFLPESERERQAILLFSDQRSAKRSCSRNQRVIKIPNTNVFKLSKSYLISKGITRLILEDLLIGLDIK